VKKQHDLEENIFGFVDISHRRYKLRRDVEQTPISFLRKTKVLEEYGMLNKKYIGYGTYYLLFPLTLVQDIFT
jgi:hypothetical protein